MKDDSVFNYSLGCEIVAEASKLQVRPPRVRHELKYIVPANRVEEVRAFLAPFCCPDPNTKGEPPFYTVSTLQLDSPHLSLHYAKERKLVNRFKLRLRTYGEEPEGTVFFEVKRKEDVFVRKTRSRVQIEDFGESLFADNPAVPEFSNLDEQINHYEFLRLSRAIGAVPVVHIRYDRESWIGNPDTSVRVTMDHRMRYRRAKDFSLRGLSQLPWRSMDGQVALRRPYGGVVLEMKCSLEVPKWILYLVRLFGLERTGFCKYSTAMRLESLFSGTNYSAGSERCLS